MKPEMKSQWTDEDFELHEAFEDVSDAYQSEREPSPRVPSALDRRIRRQARYHIGEELRNSWIFSKAPQLAVAASLMFGIGVYFVVAVDNQVPVNSSEVAPVFDDGSVRELKTLSNGAPAIPQDVERLEDMAQQLEHERLEEAAQRSAQEYRLIAPSQGIPVEEPEQVPPGVQHLGDQVRSTGSDTCDSVTFAFSTDNTGRPIDPRVVGSNWCVDHLAALESEAERSSYRKAVIARSREQLMQVQFTPNTEMEYQVSVPSARNVQE